MVEGADLKKYQEEKHIKQMLATPDFICMLPLGHLDLICMMSLDPLDFICMLT